MFAHVHILVIPSEPTEASRADLQNGNKAVLGVCTRQTFRRTCYFMYERVLCEHSAENASCVFGDTLDGALLRRSV